MPRDIDFERLQRRVEKLEKILDAQGGRIPPEILKSGSSPSGCFVCDMPGIPVDDQPCELHVSPAAAVLRSKLVETEKERDEARYAVKATDDMASVTHEENERLRAEIWAVTAKLAESHETLEATRENLRDTIDHVNKLRAKMDFLERDRRASEDKNVQLQKDLAHMTSSRDEALIRAAALARRADEWEAIIGGTFVSGAFIVVNMKLMLVASIFDMEGHARASAKKLGLENPGAEYRVFGPISANG